MDANLLHAAQFVECLARLLARRCCWAASSLACRTDVDNVGPLAAFVLERDVGSEDLDHVFLPPPVPTNYQQRVFCDSDL